MHIARQEAEYPEWKGHLVKKLLSIKMLVDVVLGTWVAGFLVVNLQRMGDGYFHPAGKMASSSGQGFWGWVANVIIAIPQLSLFLLLVAFSYMAAVEWGASTRKEKIQGTLMMGAVHLALSLGLSVQFIEDQAGWFVHLLGPSLCVGVAFLLYVMSEGATSLSNGLFIFAGSWEAGYVISGVTSKGAAYFKSLSDLQHHFSATSIMLVPAGMGFFFMWIIFSALSVEGNGPKEKILGTLKMMGMHLLFAPVPMLLIAGITDWMPGSFGKFVTSTLGLALFIGGLIQRKKGN
ncbi:hypothetical protein [Ktedonospora formicarum]|uniref:Uncharacterized protein n=1 Tax=Ktedonospora formicarum TaxID=2778364 RepID=A0A8J3I2P6_9CHLR|nr:hypothetical protein [Ktedonospora formicarum]GHO48224.1 hypothetical protein KSX_63870 [Ktedonospora formicarum]